MRRPLIGILGNTLVTPVGAFVSAEKEYVNCDYIRSVYDNGGAPVLLPSLLMREDAASAMEAVDGLLVPGGEDVHPLLYGEEPEEKCGTVRPEIDAAWKNAVLYAWEHKIPMLGICKGIQFINVCLGGTLYQDLSYRKEHSQKHMQLYQRTYLFHHVNVDGTSRLSHILESERVLTNSMHHQCVKDIGKGLHAVAHADDGVIEALEDDHGLVEAVQWHPEGLIDTEPVMNNLFRDLVERAQARSADAG